MEPTHRWCVEQRLAFIERRLYWDGQINRSDLVGHFSISVPQASADRRTKSPHPGNMHYDKSARTYFASSNFQHRAEPSARQYLAQLQLIADEPLAPRESWLGDYGMIDGIVEIEVRLSLVYYLTRQMLLDVADGLPAERAQVSLLNRDELNEHLVLGGESPVHLASS